MPKARACLPSPLFFLSFYLIEQHIHELKERCQNVVRWSQLEFSFVITWLFLSENPIQVKCIQLHCMVGAAPGLSPSAWWSGGVGEYRGEEGWWCRTARQAAGMTSAHGHWALPLCWAHTEHAACDRDMYRHEMLRVQCGVKITGRERGRSTRHPASTTQHCQGHEKQGRLRNCNRPKDTRETRLNAMYSRLDAGTERGH